MANGNNRKVLVLGATGGIGGEVARQLRDQGWDVYALHRHAAPGGERRDGMAWVRGDALRREDVVAAAQGCDAIVHAVNPPGYRRWSELVLPMIDNTIAAATAAGATVVLPGTVYNYGPDAFPVLREDSPQRPRTRKGAVRVELERRLQQAADAGGCRMIIVRAGDFFGPQVGNSWFAQGLVKPGRPVATVLQPGQPGVGHQWSYLPDVARTMVLLLERRAALPAFAPFHMAGHWDADGTQMAAAIVRAVVRSGGAQPRVRAFPWWLTALAAPLAPTLRELREMRYLWQQPVGMANDALCAVLGAEPHTPLDEAVQTTLQGLGCLPAPAATAPGTPRSPARLPA
ncbi:MAG: NAD-dependent epimerase/dehydratase family protein [Acidovorax sp.]|uniref:NAD-dependent epimerase/dehydratase family protein n=1 Tax=Acidovorax sp. TaxID=1872122 RepID=UPI0039E4E637